MLDKTYVNAFIKDCKDANIYLSNYIKNHISSDDYNSLGYIGNGGDIVKQIDLYAQNIFTKFLLKYSNILSEESGLISSNDNDSNKLIILDPIDGSDNLMCAMPYYGTSIALQVNNITQIAFIYNLSNDKYYFKSNYSNNINILNKESEFGIFERAYTQANICTKLTSKNIKYRSPGAVALSIANTHNYDFFLLAANPRIEDICAGLFICEDLNIYQNKNFLLISKNIETFCTIKDIIKDI